MYLRYCTYIRFAWDPVKNKANRRKHGIRFETATEVFDDPLCLVELNSVVDGEERWQAIGRAGRSTLLLVVHTVDGEYEEEVWLISARKADRNERRNYELGPI